MRSTTLFAEGNLVLCPLIYNDVLVLLEMMLTASGQTMLCPADTNTKRKTRFSSRLSFWRRHPDSDWGIEVLQTCALPLGYGAVLERKTRFELATFALARRRSTTEQLPQIGAFGRKRTTDTGIFSPLLYRLSYKGSNGDPKGARTLDL